MKNLEKFLGLIIGETPEDRVIRKELFYIVHKTIEKLNPRHRKIVHLFYWDQLSYRKIANIIGSTPGSVGVTLTNIRKKLRFELKKIFACKLGKRVFK
jgi:RNA polymerase sigma-70 factor (ECF subfamily)